MVYNKNKKKIRLDAALHRVLAAKMWVIRLPNTPEERAYAMVMLKTLLTLLPPEEAEQYSA